MSLWILRVFQSPVFFQVMKEEEEEQLEGDAAVNKLFQKIYRDSDDEVKKAMLKSYVNHFCLSLW